MTVCDYRHLRVSDPSIDLIRTPAMAPRGENPNAEAALELDFEGFMQLLYRTLKAYR
jgi:pyrimidine-specific ribonucleoside hydrolase